MKTALIIILASSVLVSCSIKDTEQEKTLNANTNESNQILINPSQNDQ